MGSLRLSALFSMDADRFEAEKANQAKRHPVKSVIAEMAPAKRTVDVGDEVISNSNVPPSRRLAGCKPAQRQWSSMIIQIIAE